MDLPESSTHSFIIKVWLEETAEEAGQATWRGHITHVPTGKRRYMQTLDEIPLFMVPYVKSMGVPVGKRWWMKNWLRRLAVGSVARSVVDRRNALKEELPLERKECKNDRND